MCGGRGGTVYQCVRGEIEQYVCVTGRGGAVCEGEGRCSVVIEERFCQGCSSSPSPGYSPPVSDLLLWSSTNSPSDKPSAPHTHTHTHKT